MIPVVGRGLNGSLEVTFGSLHVPVRLPHQLPVERQHLPVSRARQYRPPVALFRPLRVSLHLYSTKRGNELIYRSNSHENRYQKMETKAEEKNEGFP